MRALTGTSHFIDLKAVEKYYGKNDAKTKLIEGAVSIGKPELKEGQKLFIAKSEGRYFIEH
jgi:hypothetical protein